MKVYYVMLILLQQKQIEFESCQVFLKYNSALKILYTNVMYLNSMTISYICIYV